MAEYEFIFVLDGISIDDAASVQALTDGLDALVSSFHGAIRMVVNGEGPDAVTAAGNVATRARDLVPGIRLLRLDRDLVGVSDIAERAGRTRQNVTQWVHGQRHDGTPPFPAPEGTAGRSLVWLWSEVNEWLRGLGLGDGEDRPTRAEMARIDFLLCQEAQAVHLNLDIGAERDDTRRVALRLEQHARSTPQFVDFLLRHPEARDSHGRYALLVCCPDDEIGDLFRRLAAYRHPVVFATITSGVYAQVLTPGAKAEGEPVGLEPGTTVRDWLGLMKLYPDRVFSVAPNHGVGTSLKGVPLELTAA